MAKLDIEVGGDLRGAAADVASAWKAAAAGRPVTPSDKIVFHDWASLCAVLTSRRYDLLRAIHKAPAPSVRALARRLDCDIKRVHGDVVALEAIGLLTRSASGEIATDVDEITSTIRLAA